MPRGFRIGVDSRVDSLNWWYKFTNQIDWQINRSSSAQHVSQHLNFKSTTKYTNWKSWKCIRKIIYIFIFTYKFEFYMQRVLQKILCKTFKFHTLKHVLYEVSISFFFNNLKCKFAWLELQHFDFLLLIFILSINCLVFIRKNFIMLFIRMYRR